MRRAHRRFHLLIWLAIAPAVLAGVVLALSARPPDPVAEIPEPIASETP